MTLALRSIFRRVLGQTLVTLTLLTLIFVTTQILNEADILVSSLDAAATLLYFGCLIMPSIVIVLLPVALLIGVCRTFGSMTEDREMIVLQASGLSCLQLMQPVMLLAALLAGLVLALSLVVEPSLNVLSRDALRASSVALIQKAANSHAFVKLNGNLTMRVGEIAANGDWNNIFIADNPKPEVQKLLIAPTSQLLRDPSGIYLVMHNGEMLLKNENDAFPSRTRFASNVFAIQDNLKDGASERAVSRERGTATLLAPCDHDCGGPEERERQKELVRRISDWLYVFSFAAVAAFVCGSATPAVQKGRWNMPIALGIALVSRCAGLLALGRAGQSAADSVLAVFIPLATTGLAVAALMWRQGWRSQHVDKGPWRRFFIRNKKRPFPEPRHDRKVRQRDPLFHARLLFWVYFWRLLRIVTQTSGLFLIAVSLVDFLDFTRRNGSAPNYSVVLALQITALKLPGILFDALPFFVLLATVILLYLAGRRRELVVLKSSGISALQILTPLACGGVLVGILAISLLSPLAISTQSRFRDLTQFTKGIPTLAPETEEYNWFWQKTPEGSLFVGGIQKVRQKLRLLRPVLVEFDSAGNLAARTDAALGELTDEHWRFTDIVRTFPEGAYEKSDHYSVASPLSPSLVKWQFVRPSDMSIIDLPQAVYAFREMGMASTRLMVRLMSLLFTPLTFVAMILVAAPIGFRFSREGMGVRLIGGALLAGFCTYVVTALAQALGNNGVLPALLATGLPASIAAICGVTWLVAEERMLHLPRRV